MNHMEVKRKRFSIISSIILLLNILVLSGVLGEHGMGYLAGVLECFFLLLLITVYTLPEAMSKLIRARIQKGQNKNAMRVFKAALGLGLLYSIAGSLIIIICSDVLLENLFKTTYGSFSLKLLMPAYVLFVFVQVLRGFFQGMGTTVPTGVSQIIGSVVLFGTGILFCYLLGRYGNKIADLLHNKEFISSYSGAGVSIGIAVAEIFSVLFLVFVYQTNKRNLRKGYNKENFKMTERISEIMSILIITMLPYIACAVLGRIGIWGGMSLYQHNTGIDIADGIGVCGAFYGKYLAIILLIIMIIRLNIINIEGQIHIAVRKDEYKNAREWLAIGTHLIIVKGAFWAVIVAILGNTLITGAFKDNTGNAGNMLMHGSTLILFMALGIFFINVLISQGKIKRVILNMFCGAIIFFVYAVLSIRIWHIGVDGIIIGLCINWFMIMCGCGFLCVRSMKWKAEWVYMVVIPIGCAALTGIIVMLLNKALVTMVGGVVSVLICLVIGVFGYYILLMAFRGIRRDELEVIPGGKIWCKFAEMIHFL